MWSDDINKKIIEGEEASHLHHPEKAWDNMEALLDKHLPQEKKRRRFILLLLPLLLGAGLATFYFLKTNSPGDTITANKTEREQPANVATAPGNNTPTPDADKKNEPGEAKNLTQPEKREVNKSQTPADGITATEPGAPGRETVKDKPAREKITRRVIKRETQKTTRSRSTSKPTPVTTRPNRNTAVEENIVKEKPAPAENKPGTDSAKNETASTPKGTRKPGSFADKFSLTFSFGPDVSAVGFDNPGSLQLQYGIGAAYAISRNLTIRTGFYAGNKKYDADSSDYRMPYPINKLEKVEADCFVYEIPVSLVYSFNRVKKHNWFVSAGVSSYIMKEETYGYYYTNTWNQPQYYDRTYRNENTHLFSVIGISGGYQYHISNRLSLFAEPYLKVPVSGIGVGRVKLDNTGVLFTLGYKPFSKK